jgi:transposase InsO family protein
MVTDQGKEFVAKICQQIRKKLDLLHVTTSARHPQANAQAEVVNKTIAWYLASFVNDTTLDCWEPYLAPLMFPYNRAYHCPIKNITIFLYGVHPTLPNEISSLQYGSDLPEDIMARLQIAGNIAREHIEKATEVYKQQFDNMQRSDYFLLDNRCC